MAKTVAWSVGDSRSFTHKFTREEIDAFARLTGDMNPLHVDADYARRTPAGGQVVHGMLAASFVSTLVGMHIPGPGALWNSFQVNWRKIVRINDTLRFEVRVTNVNYATSMLELEISGTGLETGEAYLDGKAKVMIMSEEEKGQSSDLERRRVLVTGATGELGRAICEQLASAGMRLVLWGRDEERLRRTASDLEGQVDSWHAVDLLDSTAIDAALNEVMSGGDVYAFVHLAAPQLAHAAVNEIANQQQLQEQWMVGVAALNQISLGLLSGMKDGGCIVAVLSQYVFDIPPVKMSAYVSAKMAAWGLIKAMAVELGPRGIRCNAVSPGVMNTPYSKDMPLRFKQVEAASNPLRRLCQVEDVARTVSFLCGPGASFINGVNIPVTGGARMP
jgi:3-oxoacyl-[acyl-carrier protein] reductase